MPRNDKFNPQCLITQKLHSHFDHISRFNRLNKNINAVLDSREPGSEQKLARDAPLIRDFQGQCSLVLVTNTH